MVVSYVELYYGIVVDWEIFCRTPFVDEKFKPGERGCTCNKCDSCKEYLYDTYKLFVNYCDSRPSITIHNLEVRRLPHDISYEISPRITSQRGPALYDHHLNLVLIGIRNGRYVFKTPSKTEQDFYVKYGLGCQRPRGHISNPEIQGILEAKTFFENLLELGTPDLYFVTDDCYCCS